MIVEKAIEALANLNHRGASGAEVNTGDGAGLLIQTPDEFFHHECAELGINLRRAAPTASACSSATATSTPAAWP